jgi:hypothetical protein
VNLAAQHEERTPIDQERVPAVFQDDAWRFGGLRRNCAGECGEQECRENDGKQEEGNGEAQRACAAHEIHP